MRVGSEVILESSAETSRPTLGRRSARGFGQGGLSWYDLATALALVFAVVVFAQLAVLDRTGPTLRWVVPPVLLAACALGSRWALRCHLPSHDHVMLPIVVMLVGQGLAEVARLAPPAFLYRQMVWLALGSAAMVAVAVAPVHLDWLRRYRYTWLLFGLLLLSLTFLFGVNPSGAGARLWLGLGGLYFQPSELLKLLMVVFLASYLAQRRSALIEVEIRLGRWRLPHPAYLGPLLLMWGFSVLVLVWQRDLGAGLLFFGMFLAMLYAATGQVRYVLAGIALLMVAAAVAYRAFDLVALRVEAWWNPWRDAAGRSYQIVQALLAFASGGVFGQGLGQGLPTAIPVVHTDFVFAAIGEEFGIIGALGIVLCLAVLTSRAFRIALRCEQPFEQLLATGIGTLLGLQSLVIMMGTLKLIPLTGITLPFVSYGGSSLLVSMIMVGLLMHISGRDRA